MLATDTWLLPGGTGVSTSMLILLMIFVKFNSHSRIGPMTL